MPSIAKTLGLILILAGPAHLAAQTPSSHDLPLDLPRMSSRSGDPATPAPLAPPGQAPLPLAPRGDSNQAQAGRAGNLPSVITVAGSLAVVLGIFFLVAWGMRRAAPPGSTALPGEVFELLGRAPMTSRQQVHLLRCGNKLLLVSVTPAGTETLTEITDPLEVDRLAGLCRQARPDSATEAFRQVLRQFTYPRSTQGFPGDSNVDDLRPADTSVLSGHYGLENRNV